MCYKTMHNTIYHNVYIVSYNWIIYFYFFRLWWTCTTWWSRTIFIWEKMFFFFPMIVKFSQKPCWSNHEDLQSRCLHGRGQWWILWGWRVSALSTGCGACRAEEGTEWSRQDWSGSGDDLTFAASQGGQTQKKVTTRYCPNHNENWLSPPHLPSILGTGSDSFCLG